MSQNCNFYIPKQDISVLGCNCKIHSGLCEQIDYCYYKQLQTSLSDKEKLVKACEEIIGYMAESSSKDWDNTTAKQMYLIASQVLSEVKR